jgi:hypothetical protein
MVRFSKCHGDLVDRCRQLVSSPAISHPAIAKASGINLTWVRRFAAGRAKKADISNVCKLYLALVGESAGR